MAGDLYVRIRVAKHKQFERRGADLFIERRILLVEALTGVAFTLPFLDGTQLNIATSPG
jgi:DnaJ-class molecular chaperone